MVVLLTSGERFEGKDAQLSPVELVFRDASGASTIIPIEKIRTLYVAEGNKAGLMGLLGGLVGLVVVLSALLQSQPPGEPEREVDTGASIGIVGVGVLVGVAVGSGLTTWKVVPLPSAEDPNASIGTLRQ